MQSYPSLSAIIALNPCFTGVFLFFGGILGQKNIGGASHFGGLWHQSRHHFSPLNGNKTLVNIGRDGFLGVFRREILTCARGLLCPSSLAGHSPSFFSEGNPAKKNWTCRKKRYRIHSHHLTGQRNKERKKATNSHAIVLIRGELYLFFFCANGIPFMDVSVSPLSIPPKSDYKKLSVISKLLPGTPSTIRLWRWCRNGIKTHDGSVVRLHHIRVGRNLMTTPEACRAFFQHVAAGDLKRFNMPKAHL